MTEMRGAVKAGAGQTARRKGAPEGPATAMFAVMPGLGVGIHDFYEAPSPKNVDGRDEPGHDVDRMVIAQLPQAPGSPSARKCSSQWMS